MTNRRQRNGKSWSVGVVPTTDLQLWRWAPVKNASFATFGDAPPPSVDPPPPPTSEKEVRERAMCSCATAVCGCATWPTSARHPIKVFASNQVSIRLSLANLQPEAGTSWALPDMKPTADNGVRPLSVRELISAPGSLPKSASAASPLNCHTNKTGIFSLQPRCIGGGSAPSRISSRATRGDPP